MKLGRFVGPAVVALVAFVLSSSAGAAVKKEGTWPAVEKDVDLAIDGPPSEALKVLAREAGWSLVLQDGAAIDAAGTNVHVAVQGQAADTVLDALFVGRDVVAHRSGQLVTLTAASTPIAAASARTPSPFPTARGEDRDVVGSNVVVSADEIVHDVTVTGGSATVKGTVTGSLVVTGGSATLRSGAHVVGDATVLGGKLRIEKGARVDGSARVTGGKLERDDGATIGGEVSTTAAGRRDRPRAKQEDAGAEPPSRVASAAQGIGRALTRASLLFVLGCVLLALLGPRMERLRVEVASRPMRSFALGLVGAIAGSIALAVTLFVLCVTVIGIPVAIALALGLFLALYGSVASVLTTFGAAVAGHRTDNPYVQLLVGCGAYLVATCIPWIGGLTSFVVIMLALGALLGTRGAGFFERKSRAALMA
ncbi:MAG: polymer-forming cytoskeletal protein [Labilithrix sp.]|nr:polymer-forming cytoskeletal protein [Labilithrix sp.]MCW5815778.1 polymer-forming cytoskeletal protein [Labilithrix sp.]